MKNKMKILPLVIFITALIANFSLAEESEGFRDLKWGTNIFDIKNEKELIAIQEESTGIDEEIYKIKNDKLILGSAKLKSIQYTFWKNKLISVTVTTNGYANFQNLKESAFNKFENWVKKNKYREYWLHEGEETIASMDYNDISGNGYILMVSKKLYYQKHQEDKENARSKANSDF